MAVTVRVRLPGWLRVGGYRLVVIVGGVAAAGLAVLLWGVTTGASAGVDLFGHRFVHGTAEGGATAVARVISTAASSPVLYPLMAVAGGLLSSRAGWARLIDALAGLVVLVIGSGLRTGLSVVVGRPRPPVGDWLSGASGFAFPSGHTANVTVVLGVLLLIARREQRRWWGWSPWLAGGLVVAAVGWSRVFLGVHWPTDVLAGGAFGVVWVALVVLIGNQLTRAPGHPVTVGRPDG